MGSIDDLLNGFRLSGLEESIKQKWILYSYAQYAKAVSPAVLEDAFFIIDMKEDRVIILQL